jgi:hypothetical protein
MALVNGLIAAFSLGHLTLGRVIIAAFMVALLIGPRRWMLWTSARRHSRALTSPPSAGDDDQATAASSDATSAASSDATPAASSDATPGSGEPDTPPGDRIAGSDEPDPSVLPPNGR